MTAILRLLRRAGAFAEKTHGSAGTRIGMPDIIACYKGYYIALEVKVPGKHATVPQERVLEEIRTAGGWGEVVTSVAEVKGILQVIDTWDSHSYLVPTNYRRIIRE